MDLHHYIKRPEFLDRSARRWIDVFFNWHQPLLQEECDHAAARLVGAPVYPTLDQGTSSYTVVSRAGASWPTVVQFRRFQLDIDLMGLARETYGRLVPACEARGVLGDTYVYMEDFVPGIAFGRAQRRLFAPQMENSLLQTVEDYARYFSLSLSLSLSCPPC